MKVLVCGGRDYGEWGRLSFNLDTIHRSRRISQIIAGAANGADTLAVKWATVNGIPFMEFPADWNTYGRAAGYKRNAQMLEEGKPDLVVAFPGGRGTASMAKLARKAGVETIEIKLEI